MNKIILMGRLTKEVELVATHTGIVIYQSSIAVKNTKSRDDKTDYFDLKMFEHTGKFASQYFHKGDPIAVSGSCHIKEWKAADGTNKKAIEVLVDEVYFVPKHKESKTEKSDNAPKAYMQDIETEANDFESQDLPF